MLSKPPSISVVINTYNRAKTLDATLRSLRRLNYPNFEAIVVNGPSTDDTLEVLKAHAPYIRVGTCSDRNLSVSRNVGIDMARGDLVAFVDDDSLADENWLNDAALAFDSEQVGAVGGSVYSHTGYDVQYRYTICDRLGNARLDRTEPAAEFNYPGCLWYPSLQGGNAILRRDALLEIGGFDEEFDYFLDETDVCLRLVDAGYILKQLPNAFIYHRNAPSFLRNDARVVTDYRSIIKNLIYFSLKNAPPDTRFLALLRDWERRAAEAENNLKYCIAHGLVEPEKLERFYPHADAAFREGIQRGLTHPRRFFQSAAAKQMRGPIAQDVLDDSHRGLFKPCPVVLEASQKLTICLLSQVYPPQFGGGIGRLTYDVACGLAARGHIVHVLTRSSSGNNTVDCENDVWVHRLIEDSPEPAPPAGVTIPVQLWNRSARLVREIRRIHEAHPIDIVEAPLWDVEGIAGIVDGSFCTVTSLHTPLKMVLKSKPDWEDGSPAQQRLFREMIAAETLVATRADGVRANSQAIIETLRDLYGIEFRPGQVTVVPHGMEDRMSAPTSEAAGERDVRFVDVLFTGRLEPRKGIDVLLQVIPQLCSRYERARFILVGEDAPQAGGATRAGRFRARHANSSFLDRVIFAGKVSDAELERYLAQCHIFVAPSHYESFGLVFLEAMMFGKPAIGCRAGGMPEVIEEGVTGLLADPGDARSLSAALSELIADAGKRQAMGKAGRQRFLQHYTREALAERTLAFYRQVLASRQRRAARENQAELCTV